MEEFFLVYIIFILFFQLPVLGFEILFKKKKRWDITTSQSSQFIGLECETLLQERGVLNHLN